MGSKPFVLAKAGTQQGDRLRPLDFRLRGNERRLGYGTDQKICVRAIELNGELQ